MINGHVKLCNTYGERICGNERKKYKFLSIRYFDSEREFRFAPDGKTNENKLHLNTSEFSLVSLLIPLFRPDCRTNTDRVLSHVLTAFLIAFGVLKTQ